MATPRLRMASVAVAYGELRVLDGVDLEVGRGEVHALLGENGAGKSTLLKALLGAAPLCGGRVEVDGVPFLPRDPLHAARCGIAMIHQELSVLPHLTVADNILLGREQHRRGVVDRSARDDVAARALALLGHRDVALAARTGDLSPARRQIVEIARALAQEARVLVMDEPTSSLDGDDVARLLAAVATLRARGLAIVYVSHLLAEVRAVATTTTVLRDGRAVLRGALADFDDDALVRAMAGRDVERARPRAAAAQAVAAPATAGAPVLAVDGLAGEPLPHAASLQLHRGEILGIGGLCGSGRTELLEVLCGLRRRRAGSVRWHDRVGGGAPELWQAGVGAVAEDRARHGLALARSIAHNVVLPSARRLARRGWLGTGAVGAATARACAAVAVRSTGPWQRAGELSGGNQQKVAFARLLCADAAVWLLDEPTRGIDVQSRRELYAALAARVAAGAAILVVSSQLDELLLLCDRIAVMRDGELGAARPAAEWTQESLLREALGGGGAR